MNNSHNRDNASFTHREKNKHGTGFLFTVMGYKNGTGPTVAQQVAQQILDAHQFEDVTSASIVY